MSDDVENHTLRLLQELRAEMREMRTDFGARIDGLELKIDGNTVLLNLVAGVTHDHEQRLRVIEGKPT